MWNRICFVTSSFPPTSMGGVQRYLLNVMEVLARKGYDLTILTRYYPGLPRKESLPGCSIHRIGLNPFPFSNRRYIGAIPQLTGNAFTYSILGYFEGLKLAQHSEIIHSHLGSISDIVLASKLARRLGKKHVATIHGRFGTKSEDLQLGKHLLDSLRNTHTIIVNRTESQETLKAVGFNNVEILRNPVRVGRYRRPPVKQGTSQSNQMEVLFVGRLAHRRGPQLAVRGFTYAAKMDSQLKLSIVGEGVLRGALESYVEKQGLGSRVRFLGLQFDIRPFLWNSSIFLATSPIANSPSLSLREAMAAGLAVVATDVEETSDIVSHERSGLLVPPIAKEIGQAILRLKNSDSLRAQLAMEAAKYAQIAFDLEAHVSRLAKVYEQLGEH